MSEIINILILEDVPLDAELMEYELRREGINYLSKLVESREDYLRALDEFKPDLILADHSLPDFDGISALKIAKETIPQVPFILVSGKIGEEFAVDCLQKGATDYVLKSNLSKLVPAVKRALIEVNNKLEEEMVYQSLIESENRYHSLFEFSPISILEEDFSKFKKHIDQLRASGVQNFREYFDDQPEEIKNSLKMVNVIDINKKSLEFFDFNNKDEMFNNLSYYFVEDSLKVFKEQIISLAEGNRSFEGEIPLRTNNGEKKYFYMKLSVPPGFEKTLSRVLAMFMDITERKKAEDVLRNSEERWRQLVENHPTGSIIHSQGRILYANKMSLKLAGATHLNQIVGKDLYDFVHPDYHDLVRDRVKYMSTTGRYGKPTEEKFLRLDGKSLDVEVTAIPLTYMGKPAWQTVFWDITERKQSEYLINESLREKEVLLKEIHHRVKNNMQIISSLLSLQSEYLADKSVEEIFNDCRNRIRSMALVHENLYKSENMARIFFDEYVRTLIKGLINSNKIDTEDINININVDKVLIDVETAIPCGLIINELITNSFKHAFLDRSKGEMGITVKLIDNNFKIIVYDDGVGFPENLDFKNTDTLGLSIVNILVSQLNGEIQLDRNNGTKFEITFKEQDA